MASAKIAGMIEEFKRNFWGDKVLIYNNGRIIREKNRSGILQMLDLAHNEENQERIKYYQTMLDVIDGKRE